MQKVEKAALKFLKDRGWDKLKPSDLAKSISIESGELLELFQWSNLPLHEVKSNKEKTEEIGKELADVFLYALYLSVLLNIDTEKIILKKLKHASEKYPVKIFKTTGEEDPGTEAVYHSIKKKYRRKGLS